MDTTNMPKALITASNDSENPGDGDILHMYHGSMNWHADDPSNSGSRMDGSSYWTDAPKGQSDALNGWVDTLSMSDSAEMASISHGDNLGTYLGAGGVKHSAEVTDGFGNYTDPSSARTGVLSVGKNVNMTVNEPETFSMPLIEPKPPDPLTMGANACANKPNSCRNPAHMLTGHGESPGIETDAEMSANTIEIIRASQNHQTYLFEVQEVPQMSQTAVGTDRMHRVDAWTRTALETMRKRL